MDELSFPLKRFPARLARSLCSFAAAGTAMAAVVWHDGSAGHWVPLFLLVGSLGVPLAFYWQIWRAGFDPLQRLVATPAGLEAHSRVEGVRFIPWQAMQRLVQIEGFRYRAWAIFADEPPLRWFGELDDPQRFADLVAERTGLQWEFRATPPEHQAGNA